MPTLQEQFEAIIAEKVSVAVKGVADENERLRHDKKRLELEVQKLRSTLLQFQQSINSALSLGGKVRFTAAANNSTGCRVPGCANPAGPRNGFICKQHQAELGKREIAKILADWKASHSKVKSANGTRRPLDMKCRVEGCSNRSKGPRFGYMCEEHTKLPKAEQKKALEAYRANQKGEGT